VAHCQGVLAELGWDRFEIFAVSGGTPLGLHLAHALGARVIRTTVACGLGPLGDPRASRLMSRKARTVLSLIPRIPAVLLERTIARSSLKSAAALKRDSLLVRVMFDASPADLEVLAHEAVLISLARAKGEAFAQGGAGPQADALSYFTPWEWELPRFSGTVRFFHGKADRVIPPTMASFMAGQIPGAELHLIEGEGHFSLPVRHLARMLE
jgi:pimeloyl-ACP methyl ester carboxylesterase